MRRLRAMVAAALVAVTALAAAPSASAAPADLDAATAAARMLRASDVTPAMGLPGPFTRDLIEGDRLAPELCNQANQLLISGPAGLDKVAIDLIQPDTSSIQQAVFEYASRAAAQDAFTRTARRARQCDQRNAVSDNTVQVLSNGAAPIQYKGVPGVWTRETQAGRGPGGRVVYDAYTVTLLVGESIQQVTLTIVGEGRAADVQRSAADTLALTLAKRWQRGTSRSR